MSVLLRVLLIILGIWAGPCAQGAMDTPDDAGGPSWYVAGEGATPDEIKVRLYFYWTRTCPHCQRARPDVEALVEEFAWLDVQSRELTADTTHAREYARFAHAIGERPSSVPSFLFCGRMLTGYDSRSGMGALLRTGLLECRERMLGGQWLPGADDVPQPRAVSTAQLPGLGDVDLTAWSLPLVAITLGGLDSFNPCAFFVLLFLLSLLVNARSRKRMLLIGGMFVGVSGLVYFLFMAAWLNLFLMVGQLAWVTLGAGVLALVIGLVNVKDFFWFKRGLTLGIPDSAKPGLFQRMRGLVNADRLPTLLTGTLMLAVVANAYELFCTAGFPMVFARILTLQNLSVGGYYGYIGLYCLVYVLPLLAIVGVFVFTLGRRKLSEREGRVLKLMSGLMMASLGVLLIVDPGLLGNLLAMLALLGGAIAGTVVISRLWPEVAGPTR